MNTSGMGIAMWIFWVIIFLFVALAIKLLFSANNKQTPSSDSPIEILKKRYANGEIDEDEFERRRKELES